MKRLFTLWITILFLGTSQGEVHAQVLVNGSIFHSTAGSVVYVNTDSLVIENDGYLLQEGLLVIDKDLVVNDGLAEIDGTTDINENLINNDELTGLSANSFILLNGNWINNSVFVPGLNTTELDGTTQNITGTQNTSFYNLEGQGNLADVKRLVGVDATVLNELNIGDVELATDANTLSVTNPAVNAVVRNNGFVSSLDVGRLERATNTMLPYLFPTGSTAGVVRYRPIEITPNTATAETYGVRLANTEATNEGFDVMLLGDSLCAVNPDFYHRIYGTATADISMYYIPADDGEWDAMGQWQNTSVWDKLPGEMPSTAGQFSVMTIPAWSDFTNPAFVLGAQQPELDLATEITINQGETVDLNPTYNGPIPQSVLWLPLDDVDCPNCLQTEAEPLETTVYNLEVMVTQNCIVIDSVLVIVNPSGLFLPTAFSPNGDGTNDMFGPLNDNIEAFEMTIYNRWGELVFRTTDYEEGWDGTYKGLDSAIGVYSYYTSYKFENQEEEQALNGNVTLIR